MKASQVIIACTGMAAVSVAHMEMRDPPPFRSPYNPYTGGDIDYDMPSPLNSNGGDFPCKGYARYLGTPEGRPVATWSPGGTYSMTITGHTPHNGGSCQASVSLDGGSSWKVIRSYIGNCPVRGDSSYSFTLPSDLPAGDMLFAWTWFNNEGNREMYMNCAAITVQAGGGGQARPGGAASYSSRPAMFVANVGNGICTYEGTDVDFPQPGPDPVRTSRRPHAPGNNGCGNWGGGY
ncbi:endoglucanase [Metarhizium album ARSEF 1941]|uniref:Endoglucanase n=1 Tax=Metarhizium album (strain ARSEF 1941) TaxID=1081103 RepID=A0A0B2WRH2_METAS|nr:endoglucanase [Metarhizium album ARSEF 1941]KHN95580.1 endoglucanase [Metarhizium album ARSEF 1941]